MRRRMRRRDRWGGLGSERGVCRERDERRTSRHLDENPLACMCATTRRTPSDVALSQHVLAPYSVQNVSPRFRAGGLPARAKSGAPACDTHVFLSAAAAPGTRSAARSAASANQTDVRIARVVAQCRSAHHPAGWIVHSHVWSRLVVRNSSSERASLGEPEPRASTNSIDAAIAGIANPRFRPMTVPRVYSFRRDVALVDSAQREVAGAAHGDHREGSESRAGASRRRRAFSGIHRPPRGTS